MCIVIWYLARGQTVFKNQRVHINSWNISVFNFLKEAFHKIYCVKCANNFPDNRMVPRNQPEQMNLRSASYSHHRMNPSSHKSAKLTRQDIHVKTSRSSYPRPGPQSPNYRQGYGIPDYAVGFIPPQMSSYIRPSSAINNIYSSRGYGGYPNYRSRGSDAIYHGGDTSTYRRHFGSDFSPYFQGAVNGSAVALLGFLYLLNQTQVNKY